MSISSSVACRRIQACSSPRRGAMRSTTSPPRASDRCHQLGQQRRRSGGLTRGANVDQRQRRALGQLLHQGQQPFGGRRRPTGRAQWLAQHGQPHAEQADAAGLEPGAIDGGLVRAALGHDLHPILGADRGREARHRLIEAKAIVAVRQQQRHAHAPACQAARSRSTRSSGCRPAASQSSASRAWAGRRAASRSAAYSGWRTFMSSIRSSMVMNACATCRSATETITDGHPRGKQRSSSRQVTG